METVSIFGSCISRDIFFANDPNYEVQQYVGFSSPMSIFQTVNEVIDPNEVSERFEGKNFTKRCFVLDHNKTTFSFLRERVSDYFVLDVLDARLKLFRYNDNITTYSNFVYSNQPLLEEKSKFGGEIISPFGYSDEEWYKCIDWLCEEILKVYNLDQIILHENFLVREFLDKNRQIKPFNLKKMNIDEANELLAKLIVRLEKNLEGCHILRMPDNVVADVLNKWKLHPAHFHRMYYEYGNKAMQIITGCYSNEERMLEDLREIYSCKFDVLRKNVLVKTLESKNKILTFSNKKLSQYASSFKEVICNYSAMLTYIKQICEERNLSHIAMYGDFWNSEVLADLLKKCDVKLDYIICQWDNGTAPVVYPTTADEYPEVDAIINCDIMSIEKTNKILSQKVSCPVYSVFDFLPFDGE